jgi:ATP adenylyltransferase
MEVLWAPWRGAYVTSGAKEPGCVLCRSLDSREEISSLVVHTAPLSFIVMNLFPYNAGHVMVAPRRHVGRLGDMTDEELTEVMTLARRLEAVFQEVYRPDGINLGINLGKPAGAGVADHVHLHVVPRWSGDTNFMSVVGGTRVIPEDPLAACQRLRAHFRG